MHLKFKLYGHCDNARSRRERNSTRGGVCWASAMGPCRHQQDNSEIALRGAAILARMLLGIIPPAAIPEPVQRAASSLHDQCLLVRLCQTHVWREACWNSGGTTRRHFRAGHGSCCPLVVTPPPVDMGSCASRLH